MAGAQKRSLESPDEQVRFEGMTADVVGIGDAAVSRLEFQPGTHCALGGRRLAGDVRARESCQAHHTGLAVAGRLRIEMDDGSTLDVGPNEVYDVPPGHDGWATGAEPFRAITWSGVRTWLPQPEAGERVLATLLFTDIVSSTERAAELGDAAWRELLARHNRDVRNTLDRFRGREVNTTGDGFLAVFDGAGRAIHAAASIRQRSSEIGLPVRAGIHTGEVEVVGDDVRGIAVHEAARVASAAGPNEILVSGTTFALASQGDIAFESRGEFDLKGLDGARTLYAVA
ncbi:MAG TPA: adenylate/guanylate cyclase domain-containing protein [Actinomycetota bacterium]|jgi:class 3 adenylate cyclase